MQRKRLHDANDNEIHDNDVVFIAPNDHAEMIDEMTCYRVMRRTRQSVTLRSVKPQIHERDTNDESVTFDDIPNTDVTMPIAQFDAMLVTRFDDDDSAYTMHD